MMTKTAGNILIVDDDEDILITAQLLLEHHHYSVYTEKNPHKIPALLRKNLFDVILLDMNFTEDTTSGTEGLDWLARILDIDPQAVVVFITAFGNIELAVQAIKQGAADFVAKPWQNEKLLATISLALKLRKSKEHVEILQTQQRQLLADRDLRYQEIIGNSQQMQEVFRIIKKVAATEANVLILGENGTGKELIARELHRSSHKASCPFITHVYHLGTLNSFKLLIIQHIKNYAL
jgi:DNA-binding NtrC family response regulator